MGLVQARSKWLETERASEMNETDGKIRGHLLDKWRIAMNMCRKGHRGRILCSFCSALHIAHEYTSINGCKARYYRVRVLS